MRYVRDIPRDDERALETERAHVVAHLSAVTSVDDDPEANADTVRVWVEHHPDDPRQLRIVGEIDAQPTAPYLQPGHDPFAGVAPALLKEVLGDGQA